MEKAILKKTGIVVYVRKELKSHMSYNYGKIVVSKQPNSMAVFCVTKEELEFINE